MLAGDHLGISKGLSAYQRTYTVVYHHVYIYLITDDQWLYLTIMHNVNVHVTVMTEHNKVRPMGVEKTTVSNIDRKRNPHNDIR